MGKAAMVDISILDFAIVREGDTVSEALARCIELAVKAEQWGYRRFWVAEHHNLDAFASAATALVISQIAARTTHLRVGSGGIMLPNHAPLMVAEQFGTLEALYPGRIDLGLGRASGANEDAEAAIGRPGRRETFPEDLRELRRLLDPPSPEHKVHATPGAGSQVPMWVLGSTTNGAEHAAELGLPFGFAAHFRPDNLMSALDVYRKGFKPSARLDRPRVMVTLSAITADTDEAARLLASSMSELALGAVRNAPTKLRPPRPNVEADWSDEDRERVNAFRRRAQVGSRSTVRDGLRALVAETGADELMIFGTIYDTEDRNRSYEAMAAIAREI
jgi:luciferase family oxidoreductase group 1